MDKEALIAPKNYNIASEIERYATDSKRKALIYQDDTGKQQEISYQELVTNANKIGNVFLEKGLKKGDKLLIMMPRTIAAYEIYLAALKTGIIIIACSEMLTTNDLQYRVTHGEVTAVVSYYEYIDAYQNIEQYDQLHKFVVGSDADDWYDLDKLKLAASDTLAIVATNSDDIAFLPYTSGTTGNPKGVVHTHAWGYAHLRTVSTNWLDIKEGDIVWATAAPGWQKWVWSPFLSTLGSGATGFVYNGRFSARKYLELLEANEVNVLCCTPTEYRLMSLTDNLGDFHLDKLNSAVSAGEPLNKEIIDIFEKNFKITVRDGYGQTENTLVLGIMKGMEVKPGSMGKPTPGNEVVIVNDQGEVVPNNVVGNIALNIDSPALFKEYYRDPKETEESIRGRYYITGDRAYEDEDGYFWFEGRSDDIIVSSGYTIGPVEVEEALISHPAIQDCAVIASPDEIRGNIVKAYVVLKDDVLATTDLIKELQDHVKKLTAPYKYPRKIEFLNVLPKTTSGKTRRVALRELDQQQNNI